MTKTQVFVCMLSCYVCLVAQIKALGPDSRTMSTMSGTKVFTLWAEWEPKDRSILFTVTSLSGETACTARFPDNRTQLYRYLKQILKEKLVSEQQMFVSQNIELIFSGSSLTAYDFDYSIDPSYTGPPYKRLRQKTSPAWTDLQHDVIETSSIAETLQGSSYSFM